MSFLTVCKLRYSKNCVYYHYNSQMFAKYYPSSGFDFFGPLWANNRKTTTRKYFILNICIPLIQNPPSRYCTYTHFNICPISNYTITYHVFNLSVCHGYIILLVQTISYQKKHLGMSKKKYIYKGTNQHVWSSGDWFWLHYTRTHTKTHQHSAKTTGQYLNC